MTEYRVGSELQPEDRAYVLAAYVHRPTRENLAAHPEAKKYKGRMRLVTDEEWLQRTTFAVCLDGSLDRRIGHCIYTPKQRKVT